MNHRTSTKYSTHSIFVAAFALLSAMLCGCESGRSLVAVPFDVAKFVAVKVVEIPYDAAKMTAQGMYDAAANAGR